MIKKYIGILILFISIVLSSNVEASEDGVFFVNREDEKLENPIVYFGEHEVCLRLIYGQNCSNYSVDLSSSLFTYSLFGMFPERIEAGRITDYALIINKDAPIKKYTMIAYLNYTDESNKKVSKQFNLIVDYKKSIEIKELKIPKGYGKEFSLKIETFVNFDELKVEFDSDGDIETEKHEIILENVLVGNYTFKTKIYREATVPGDAQELGYWIIGRVDNKTIEFGEANIPVKITWGNTIIDTLNNSRIIIIGIIIILVVILICYYYKRYKNHKNN